MASFVRGKGLKKDTLGTGPVPVVLYGELYTKHGNYIKDIDSFVSREFAMEAVSVAKNNLLLPISSTTKEATIGKASVLKVDGVYLGGDAIAISSKINSDYLMYVINGLQFEKDKANCISGTTIRHLNPKKLMKIKVPVPSIETQREIVTKMDAFEALNESLRNEIAARHMQYEHYRDKLLSFKKLEKKGA